MAKRLEKSSALLLRRFRHGDTSLIVHGFTREFGRIPFIAKGARSGGRKAPVPLVPVVRLEFIWATSTKSELQLLREWSLEDGFGAIHTDFVKLAWAQAAFEALGRTLSPGDPFPELFDDTIEYLHALAMADGKYENLFVRFRLNALRELGFEMDFTNIDEVRVKGRFDPSIGRLCPSQNPQAGGNVHLGTWKSMAALTKMPYEEVSRLKLRPDAVQEIEMVLNMAYRHAFDRWGPLNSLNLLKTDIF